MDPTRLRLCVTGGISSTQVSSVSSMRSSDSASGDTWHVSDSWRPLTASLRLIRKATNDLADSEWRKSCRWACAHGEG